MHIFTRRAGLLHKHSRAFEPVNKFQFILLLDLSELFNPLPSLLLKVHLFSISHLHHPFVGVQASRKGILVNDERELWLLRQEKVLMNFFCLAFTRSTIFKLERVSSYNSSFIIEADNVMLPRVFAVDCIVFKLGTLEFLKLLSVLNGLYRNALSIQG